MENTKKQIRKPSEMYTIKQFGKLIKKLEQCNLIDEEGFIFLADMHKEMIKKFILES